MELMMMSTDASNRISIHCIIIQSHKYCCSWPTDRDNLWNDMQSRDKNSMRFGDGVVKHKTCWHPITAFAVANKNRRWTSQFLLDAELFFSQHKLYLHKFIRENINSSSFHQFQDETDNGLYLINQSNNHELEYYLVWQNYRYQNKQRTMA